MEITYKAISDNDLPFLKQVYRSTREEELNLTDWSDSQKSEFIDQQFYAQHTYYQEAYHDSIFEIILVYGVEAGRLYIWESALQIRIVDIALLPEFRNKGIGSLILNSLIDKSEKEGKILSIHVECYNPALNLYNRLGFRKKDHTGVYFYMEREPGSL